MQKLNQKYSIYLSRLQPDVFFLGLASLHHFETIKVQLVISFQKWMFLGTKIAHGVLIWLSYNKDKSSRARSYICSWCWESNVGSRLLQVCW